MEGKHTPGPWVVEQYDRLLKDDHPGINIFSRMNVIAEVLMKNVGWNKAEANAALIAAAPAMLEALELVSGRIKHDDDCELSDVHACNCTKMDMEQAIIDAIAQARKVGP